MKLEDGVSLVRTILVHLLSQVRCLKRRSHDANDSSMHTLFGRNLRFLRSDDLSFFGFTVLVNIRHHRILTLYVSLSQIVHDLSHSWSLLVHNGVNYARYYYQIIIIMSLKLHTKK